MVWSWHEAGKNYKWTESSQGLQVTLNSMHANYGPASDRRYECANIEYSAHCFLCGQRRSSYVRVKLERKRNVNLHFKCAGCHKTTPIEVIIKMDAQFLMDLADDRWDREELAIAVGLLY